MERGDVTETSHLTGIELDIQYAEHDISVLVNMGYPRQDVERAINKANGADAGRVYHRTQRAIRTQYSTTLALHHHLHYRLYLHARPPPPPATHHAHTLGPIR